MKQDNINWTKLALVDTHDHEQHFEASGTDGEGKCYIGTWVECLDDVQIIDIEPA